MAGLFGRKDDSGTVGPQKERIPRHSSGWVQLLKHLKSTEGLRVLDVGPTSSSNINFLTGLGHSIYMANLVEEAASAEWVRSDEAAEDGGGLDVVGFVEHNLSFAGRVFDVVLLWDTLDYLPEAMVVPVLARLHAVMAEGGQMLAMFHSKTEGVETAFSRYHLTENETVLVQRMNGYPLLHAYTTRQAEQLLQAFASYRFFLAKDALREVLVVR